MLQQVKLAIQFEEHPVDEVVDQLVVGAAGLRFNMQVSARTEFRRVVSHCVESLGYKRNGDSTLSVQGGAGFFLRMP